MDNFQVTVKPDKRETKEIIVRYTKVAAVILCNILLFNVILRIPMYIIGGINNNFSSIDAMKEGYNKFAAANELASMCMSVFVPVISETVSIILGLKLLKINLKSLFNLNGFNGLTLVKAGTVSIGTQTIASIIGLAIVAIFSKFGLKPETADVTGSQSSVMADILLYFYACFGAPMLEEIMYRGVIMQGLRKYNERFAIVVSSLIFGLMHQNIQQCILGVMIGLIFGSIDMKSGSILPSIICHFIVNSSSALTMLAVRSISPDFFNLTQSDVLSAATVDYSNKALMAILAINAVVRYGSMLAGLVLIIIAAVKGLGLNKPTEAGKNRGWPVMAKSAAWYIVLAGYIYLTFIASVVKI